MATTKTPTTKSDEPKAPRKPRAPRKPAAAKTFDAKDQAETSVKAEVETTAPETKTHVKHEKHTADPGRYVFATGRRKTAVANVRLFTGKGDSMVNKKPLESYFGYTYYQEEIGQPFSLTGLGTEYYFTCHVNGGGPHSQAQAVRHGISIALSKISDDVRKVLKKNGLLTRDDRRKERKKPGLKRARRSPQWAKR